VFDNSSRDKRVYGLKTKNSATDSTAAYIDQMAREGIPVKCISGDGAGELGRSMKFQRMLANNGTRRRKSPPRTLQSNGIAERAIKPLMRAARSQLVKAGLGDKYWFFAITDVAFKTGGMPHEYLGGETPCERLTGKSFNYNRLQAWGSECYVHQDKQQRGASSKFHPCTKRGKIMGYDRTSLCWHIWLPQEAKLVTSAHVTFEPDEHIMDFVGEKENTSSTDDEEISDTEDDSDRDFDIAVDPIPQATGVGKNSSSPSGQQTSARIAEQPRVDYGDTEELGENIVNLLRSSTDDAYCLMGMAGDISIGHQEPSTIAEALVGPDAEHWKKAMEQEMEGQRTKGTFHEGERLPPGRRPVNFTFKIKRTAHGDIERYKARLVARGFSQQEGVDYFSTFSPVVGFDVIRAVLATVANRNWIINSLDVTRVYLNAPLPEDVWLQLPNGSIVKAARAIYGLKQSAMEWYKELKETILAEGWSVSDFDACLYVKRSEDGRIAVLFHYVDDISLTGNFLEEIRRMKNNLLTKYEGRDLGTPDKLVGVAINRDEAGITLDQHFYAESIVREGMGSTEIRSTSSPLNPGMDLTARRTDEEELDQRYKPYRTILRKLMFLVGMIRPDLSYSVRELGRYAE
ncbi:unnamed protein product, partial [Choristocarpus tenellus]